MSTEFVVLGAGPAGLGAAWKLAQGGRSVTVFEAADRVGGLAASREVAGLRVDHGSHRLHPNTPPAVLADLQALLGDDLQRRVRNGRILMSGALVPFPPSPLAMMRRLPPSLTARLVRDVVTGPFRRARADTFVEVTRASVGPTLAREFYAPMVTKLFGLPPAQLHGELARRRVSARGGRDLLRKAVRRGERGNVFWYPRRGYGQISEALAAAAVAAGARLELATEVDRVEFRGDAAIVHAAGRQVQTGAVWSTIPLPALARLAAGPVPRLRSRAMTFVYLVLERPRWSEFDAHYLVPPSIPITRLSEPRNYRDSADDPKDRTVLCAEWPGEVADETWTAAPDVLASQIHETLAATGLAVPEPSRAEVHRVEHAYPVYDLGFASELERTLAWAESLEPRLLTLGRNGLFAHDNAHHALAMAYAAVDAFGGDAPNSRERWRAARRGFAENVVED